MCIIYFKLILLNAKLSVIVSFFSLDISDNIFKCVKQSVLIVIIAVSLCFRLRLQLQTLRP